MIYLAIPLTLLSYWLARRLYKRKPLPVLNPVFISMTLLIVLFLLTSLDYQAYQQGTRPLTWLLDPAVVALAYPLYQQLEQIRLRFKVIMLSCLLGVCCSLIVGVGLALILGGTPELVVSLAPKAVTTPVAMSIADAIGGIPAVAAASVLVAGISGAIFGLAFLRKLGVDDDEAAGLAMGAASHALGTARAAEENFNKGAFSSLALVICAVLTSLIAPLLVPLLLHMF